ncbi:MAG TPA: 3-oxoacyl-[acyl-carrier-protein] synthase III C-terminal domain-containing protein [Solirubrobacteraceae bacterium]|jgi:predicted naringenin-chalcone synthase|nr:3-oxoacyl-[acyl-carrier-protein] synthase III C-terminal domain-containing protein [Solirubrobacteraceae bacterium]
MTPSGAALRHTTTRSQILAARRGRARAPVRITALRVADGPDSYTQAEVLARLGLAGDESAEGVFARCGVQRRFLNLSHEFLSTPQPDRAAGVEDELLERTVTAVDALGADLGSVQTIITSSLHSPGCPTIAHRLVDHYGLSPSVDKYHVSGVGCASAVPLMRLALSAQQAHPDRDTLVIAAESMSSLLTPARPEDPKAKTIGAAIFGDGCAAALLSGGEGGEGPAIAATAVHQVPDSLHAVTLARSGEDSYLHLARDLPEIGASELPAVLDTFLAEQRLSRDSIDHWMVHPGGRRIVEGVQDALGLTREDTATSWESLADHGNVGTPSIFYVLKATCESCDPSPGDHGLAITIGPGVSVGLMLLRW